MSAHVATTPPRSPLLVGAWWVVSGALIGFGIVGALTIGAPFLLVGAGMALVGALRPRLQAWSGWLALVGLAAGPLLLAWLNRAGPGVVCESSGDETSCVEQWSPWPFVAVGVFLLVLGVALAVTARRLGAARRRRTPGIDAQVRRC